MVNKNLFTRPAFTMIELIFAIVVIAISVMSLPMMNQVISSGIEKNLVQEAIFAASAEINEATTYRWDDTSMDDVNLSEYSRVVNISGDCNATTKLRPGHINRRCINNTLINTLSASSSYSVHGHPSTPIFIDSSGGAGSTTTAQGYKQDYNSTAVVSTPASFGQAADNPNANMKEVKVTITNADTNKTVTVLTAYVANIGELDYYKDTY